MKEPIPLNALSECEMKPLCEKLLARKGVTLVLGATDTGKSTLIREAASALARHATTALVDSDVGQSSVGPPACLGACLVKGRLGSSNRAEALHFVGSFSPERYFLPMINGIARLIRWAEEQNAAHILVDTTGFVKGAAAFELKYHKVELLKPVHVIFLERGKELMPLFRAFRFRQNMEIHRFKAPDAAVPRGVEERRQYREQSLSAYLEDARLLSIPLNNSVMINAPSWQEALEREGLLNRLVGLLDNQGNTLALGIIDEADTGREHLLVKTPLASLEAISHLRLGEIYRPLLNGLFPGLS